MAAAPALTNNITANVVDGASGNFNFDQNGFNGGNGEGSLFPSDPSFNYGNGNGVASGAVLRHWYANYTGYFYAATTGTYTFGTNSDDDSRIWINAGQANPDTAIVQNGTGGQGNAGYGNLQNVGNGGPAPCF